MVITMMLVGMSSAMSSPFHGCSFHKDRLQIHSWPGGVNTGCANFQVKPQACTKTKIIPPNIVVNYPGDIVSGRLPAYFVEVTPHRGFSVFTQDPDGAVLRVQMELAETYWRSILGSLNPVGALLDALSPGASLGTNEVMAGNNGAFMYGRTIKVPYGALAWSFPSIGVASGSIFPTCFDGISEFSPTTWADVPGHGETLMSTLQAPLAGMMCHTETGGFLLPEIPIGSPFDVVRNVCAFPVTPAMVTAGVFKPNSEAMETFANPQKACAGRLGPHLPRTGYTNTTSEWDAGQTLAYRMATLSEDHWLSGPGIELGDRWQLVWPPVVFPGGSCQRPGAIQGTEILTDGPLAMPALPGTDGPIRPGGSLLAHAEGGSPYIYAVWRRFERCVEPFQGPLFAADLAILGPVRKAACALPNSADGMP